MVTVHDVAPPYVDGVRFLLGELDRLGIERRVLKVVPNLEARWPLQDDAGLCSLLRRELVNGSEIVAHGMTHVANGPLQGSPRERFQGARFAPGAAEFLTLSAAAARRAAETARLTLADAVGVAPQGFCAPAWLINEAGRAGVRDAGYRYLLEMARLRDLKTGRSVLTPWQGHMGVGGFHELLVQVGNRAVTVAARFAWDGLERCPNVKVFLHPQQLQSGRALDRVFEQIESLKLRRQLVTPGQLLEMTDRRSATEFVPHQVRTPLVSVVIPALNEERHIAAALDSVARQRYPKQRLEAVVVDNDSRDGTGAAAKRVATRWLLQAPDTPRLQVLGEPHRGAARAKNRGAAAARGQLLVFLDADSTLGPNVVREVAAAWQGGARGGSITVMADSGDPWERGFFGVVEFGKALFGIHCQMGYLDRELFGRLGGFRPQLHLAEDLDLMRRAAAALRHTGKRMERIGSTPVFGADRDSGACILTSPRRLRALPWRLGLIWLFLRWSLGFLGIGRRRYAAGGPVPEEFPAPSRARRLAMGTLRFVLQTASGRTPGRPAGLLWIWWWWDRLYVRWHRLQPIREGGVLFYGFETYRSSRPILLGDGTRVERGDRICRIHMRNDALAGSEYLVIGQRAWGFIRATRQDLAALANAVEPGSLGRRNGRFVAVTGSTLLFRGARRMGFSVWPRPQTWRGEIERIYLMGLLALYRADRGGDETSLRLSARRLDAAAPNSSEYVLGEVWISRRELRRRYRSSRAAGAA